MPPRNAARQVTAIMEARQLVPATVLAEEAESRKARQRVGNDHARPAPARARTGGSSASGRKRPQSCMHVPIPALLDS